VSQSAHHPRMLKPRATFEADFSNVTSSTSSISLVNPRLFSPFLPFSLSLYFYSCCESSGIDFSLQNSTQPHLRVVYATRIWYDALRIIIISSSLNSFQKVKAGKLKPLSIQWIFSETV